MGKHILIVGGAGYIGSHAAKLLASRGYAPVILDDLSTGHKEAIDALALKTPFYKGSYADQELVEKICRTHSIQAVMHFGAKALVGESMTDPLLYFDANVAGTIRLLQGMRKASVRHFIFSSTCATFGEPKSIPIPELTDQNPVNPYGTSKLFVEKILRDMDRAHGMRSAILRYFNAAGADPEGKLGEDHEPETHLIPRVLKVAAGSKLPEDQLIVFGKDYPTKDGSCVRDYIHVNDLAEAHLLAMEYLWREDRSNDFNLGSEHGYSVFEVIDTAKRVVGVDVPYRIGERRPGDPPVLIGDSAKAKKILGWTPKHDLESIVRTAWKWASNRGASPGASR